MTPSSARVLDGIDGVRAAIGQHLGHSSWHTIEQDRIDAFAEATGDHQWIHVDRERAAAGPFGAPIAHGFLTLSLVPMLLNEIFAVDGVSMSINYGANRVRFPAPVPVGSRVRAGAEIIDLVPTDAGHQLVVRVTIDRFGSEKPVCVVDAVSLLVA